MHDTVDLRLRALAESDCKAFNEKIINTDYQVLGVRMPAMKSLAKEIAASPRVEAYLESAEFPTYEHVLLYGLVLGHLKKPAIETIFRYLDPLILRFDNWAHVDTIISSLKIFGKHPAETLRHFMPLKDHEGEFTKRTFVILLMDYHMNDNDIDRTLELMTQVPQGQYYVDMALAWALSVGLVKYYDKTLRLLEQKKFSRFVHNKAIQKARESYRIDPATKELLNAMKIR